MYTDSMFENLGHFTLFRPVFISILVGSLLLSLILIIPKLKNKLINGFTVISLSVLSILVSGQLLYNSGIIVDEIGLRGDPVTFYIFIAITGMGILNPIIYFSARGKTTNPIQGPSLK